MTEAEKIADELTVEYGLTYRCKVNLEAIANTLMQKLTEAETKDLLDDIISNIEFLDDLEDTHASN